MEENFDAAQGADLLGLALGKQPGASDLDDFVELQVFFDGTVAAASDGEALPFLAARLCEVFELLLPDLDHYLWHRDRFILEIIEVDALNNEAHLSGHLRIGDGIEDEWFLVHLLRKLTASRPDASCRVFDGDGEILLIEAALAAPRWLTPSNSEHRCWLRGGLIHFLPKPEPGEKPQLSIQEALAKLRGSGSSTAAKGRVQRAIEARLEGYPKRAFELSRHVARAVLPEKVARLLLAYPQIIAVILDHLPTPPSRELIRLRRDLPDEESSLHLDCEAMAANECSVLVGIRFTRLQYARLMSLRCQLPQRFSRKRWRLPLGMKESSVSERSMQLGAMLCAGLEAAYLEGPKSATATLRFPRPLQGDVLPKGAASRQASTAWPTEQDSSSVVAQRARAQQADLDAPFRRELLKALGDEALKTIDLTEYWRDRDDPEAWLHVSHEEIDKEMQARQAEFEAFDKKRAAPRSTQAPMAATASPDQLQEDIAAMGSKISGLLNSFSGHDGVDPGIDDAAPTAPAASASSTASGAGEGESDSDEDGSEDLDVLGMEDAPEDAGEDSDENAEDEGVGSGMQDYYSELDQQLETSLDGDLPEELPPEGTAAAAKEAGKLPLSSRHVKVHSSERLELDLHAMEHVLASFCSENQLEPGPASLLLGELGLAAPFAAAGSVATLDAMD